MFDKIINNMSKAAEDKKPTDYIDEASGLVYCGVCHKAKQYEVPCKELNNPIVWIACDCKKAEWEKEKARQAKEEGIVRYKRFKAHCFNGKEQDFTFDVDDSPNSNQSKQLREWADSFTLSCKDWILLYGGCGGGKSFYAAALCNAVLSKGFTARFTSISEIERQLWECECKQAIYDDIARVGLLTFDDFGAERGSEYMQEVVFNIIDCRYRSGKATILTTNLSPNEIIKPVSLNMQRIMSRICERLVPIEVNHSDRRIEALKNRI